MGARLITLLSAVLMTVLWAGPQSTAYLCSMSGERRATRCCGHDDGGHTEQGAELERPICCEIERKPTNVPPPLATDVGEMQELAGALALRQERDSAQVPSPQVFVATLARGPPPGLGPPPYLRHCTFLI